jgi:hypothetical protein
MNRRHLDRLFKRQRRQDSGEPSGQHRFARAGRADHQEVVAAGRGNFDGAPCKRLSVQVTQIRPAFASAFAPFGRYGATGRPELSVGRPIRFGLIEQLDSLAERTNGQQSEPFNDRGFGKVVVGQEQRARRTASRFCRNWQHAACRLDGAVERQLADVDDAGEIAAPQGARGRQHAERDRQVERRTGFPHVAWREVDRDAIDGEVVAGVANRGADPIAALPYRRIRKTDELKVRQSAADVNLHVHAAGVHTNDRCALESGKHGPAGCKSIAPIPPRRSRRYFNRRGATGRTRRKNHQGTAS